MIESLVVAVVCLVLGGIGGNASKWVERRSKEDESASLAIVKLSAGVEHIAAELTAIREDMHHDRREIFGRLGGAEQRIARLEATTEVRREP